MEAGLFFVLVLVVITTGVYLANTRTFYGNGPLLGVLMVVALLGLFGNSALPPDGIKLFVFCSIAAFIYYWVKSKPSKPPLSPRETQPSRKRSWHEFDPATGVPWWFALGCVIWCLCLITGAYVHLTRI